MAFKSVEQFNEDRYRNLFRLVDDGMSADVVFLYKSKADMLVADVHYIKSADYSGYVHCLGKGCPVCALKKDDGSALIRVQTKLFIPLFNVEKGVIEFWDRNMNTKFFSQLEKDVFERFPNPSEYVFKITRHGEYRDVETHYDIVAVGKNIRMPYDQILAKCEAKMPDYYENVVKTVTFPELSNMLQSKDFDNSANQEYIPVPRAGYQSSIPDTFVNASTVVSNPSEAPSDVLTSNDSSDDGDGDTELPDPIF